MKTLVLPLLILVGTSAHALEFSLQCSADSTAPEEVKSIPAMTVVKKPVFENGKWNNDRYVIRLNNKTEIALTPAGSGDEDYSEYEIIKDNKYRISGAAIQNRFKWASVLVDGSSWISCH